jgi:hypothetical protein
VDHTRRHLQVRGQRHRTVTVALYRLADVRAGTPRFRRTLGFVLQFCPPDEARVAAGMQDGENVISLLPGLRRRDRSTSVRRP